MKKIEIVGKRGPREKHFLQDDGTFVVEMYDEDIHFLKNGKYEEINSQLSLKNNYYVNDSNNYKIEFSAIVGDEIMRIRKNDKYLNISLNKHDVFLIDKLKMSNKSYDKIKYENILDGIDLQYEIIMSKIKESIILKNKEAKIDDLSFIIKTNAELQISETGTIYVVDGDEILFEFELPYLMDVNNSVNNNVKYNLIKERDYYQLFMTLDKKWLNELAIYPVIIDPTITNVSNENSVYDTYIFPNDTNVSRGNLNYFKVGVERNNGNDIINRALLKFDLPTLGTGSQVISAELYLKNYPYNTYQTLNEIIDIHRVTSNWTELGANWSDMYNAYDPRVEGAFNFYGWYGDDGNGNPIIMTETADITYLVQKWYTGTPNQGIMLKLSKEQYNLDIVPLFFSKNFPVSSGQSPKPILVIQYRNQNGIEKYMNYEMHSIEKANIYHNAYNGNMTTIFDLCSTKVGKMPVDLKLIYNTNDVVLNKNKGYGIGFKLNLNQTIKEVIIDNKTYMEYEDEDGTLHYFLDSKTAVDSHGNQVVHNEEDTYYDEDGLELKIKKYNDRYELMDKNQRKMTFTIYNGVGYLTEIEDSSGNKNTIYYDINYEKILYIEDANEQEININYGNVVMISSPTESVTLSLLDQNTLGCVVYIDNTIYISTNSNHLITMLNTDTGKSFTYEYYNESPYKLKKVCEYGKNNSLGNYYETKYNFNSTTFIDSNNRVKTIVFNNLGNPESISSLKSENDISDAYGSKSTYGDMINNVDLYKNKILENQIPIKYVKNLLTNTSFENNTIDFACNELGLLTLSNEIKHSGLQSLRFENLYHMDAETSKEIIVEKGKYYTFSAYIQSTRPVKLFMWYDDVNDERNSVYSDSYTPYYDFERIDLTIFYPSDATGNLNIGVCMENNGYCYIDDIQLEEGEVVNNYNMIENSDFSNGLSDWVLNPGTYNTNDIFSVVNVNNNQKALKVNMYTHNYSSIEKTYNIKGKMGDKYTLSFWYKNTGLIGKELFSDGPLNVVSMIFYPTDTTMGGDTIENYILNSNENEWQFFICNFTADYDFNSFKLIIDQSLNGNEFYITNINLFQDVRSVKYNYDENGNIISIKKINNTQNSLSYDKNNELVKLTDQKDSNVHYEYDNNITNRVLRGISDSGIINEVEYDSFGNIKISRIIDKEPMIIPNDGLYRIRLKGTDKGLAILNNSLCINDDNHGHYKWNLEKVTINDIEYFKINSNIINNKYLTINNDNIVLANFDGDNSLFELIKQNNGSYYIKNKVNGKYIKNNNNLVTITDLIEGDCSFEFYIESLTNGLFIENSTIYSQDGKFILNEKNTLLNETNYNIDSNTCLLKSVTNSKNQTISYNYNNLKQLTSITKGEQVVNYEYNNSNLLSKIIQKNRVYNFTYDDFNKIKTIKLGNNVELIQNSYKPNNGNIESTTFGNNQTIYYEYDEFDRLKELTRNDNTFNYKYNNNGDLAKIISNDDVIKYSYDSAKRLYEYKYNNFRIRYNYDEDNNIVLKKYEKNNIVHEINNIFDSKGTISKSTFDTNEYNYSYDKLGRLISKNINNNYSINYNYVTNGKRTSMLVDSIICGSDKYTYKYDKIGNLTKIYYNDTLENVYYYDNYNQLIKEDNYKLGKTIKYKYDDLGNILYKKECEINTDNQLNQYKYQYNNLNFVDQLTKYNDEIITYDAIGNPLSIGNNKTLSWINGRMLNSYTDQNSTINFKYNKDGVRESKIVNNNETRYYLEGNNIVLETNGNDVLYYIRSNDELIGFMYNNQLYYYVKNNYDDIIGILDDTYNLIAKYSYDSWGNIIAITDGNNNDISSISSNIANINPFRYRSYYYDKETGWYYLNSRYYNPIWGRFINIDGIINGNNLIDGNLYSYCSNDPINKIDMNGQSTLGKLVKSVVKSVVKPLKKVLKTVAKVTARVVATAVTKTMAVLGKAFGAPRAAELLGRSADKNPGNVCYGPNTTHAKAVSNSQNFQDEMVKIKQEIQSGKPLDEHSISLESFDSFLAYHRINIKEVKPNSDGTIAHVVLSDKYDFEWWTWADHGWKSIVNNVGYGLQELGGINNYDFTIEFDYSLK